MAHPVYSLSSWLFKLKLWPCCYINPCHLSLKKNPQTKIIILFQVADSFSKTLSTLPILSFRVRNGGAGESTLTAYTIAGNGEPAGGKWWTALTSIFPQRLRARMHCFMLGWTMEFGANLEGSLCVHKWKDVYYVKMELPGLTRQWIIWC